MKTKLVCLLYVLTFAPSAVEKLLTAQTPAWFLEQFRPTFLGYFPEALPLQY
jgi:hypothetical protein